MIKRFRTYLRLVIEEREQGRMSKFIRPILFVLSQLYTAGSQTVRWFYEKGIFKKKKIDLPVICVGNVTWGGSGKTPLVEYLAKRVSEVHKTPLILTRGYSRDEVNQFRHHVPRAVLGVGKNRFASAKKVRKKKKVHVAIMDDGLQHWPLERDIDLVVVNAMNPFGNEKVLPLGVLREPLTVFKRVSIVVLSHVNLISEEACESLKEKILAYNSNIKFVETCLEPLFLYRADNRKRLALNRLSGQRVATFSGIGVPESFRGLLKKCHIKTARNFEFSDHHIYSKKDLEEIKAISKSASVDETLTTEKDFYRSPKRITRILNPLVLATRLKIIGGEELINEHLFRLLGVSRR